MTATGVPPGRRQLRLTSWAAAGVAGLLTFLHVAWSLGLRWGYSACGWGALTESEARTGCRAADVADLELLDGWIAAGGWSLVLLVAVALGVRGNVPRHLVLLVATGLLLVSFPLHLLFEIPAGLAGTPTDWRHIATRVAAVGAATLLFLAVRRAPCRHTPEPVRFGERTRRAIWTAALIPCLCCTGPHLAWMSGVPLGVSEDLLADALELPLFAQVAITFSPVLGAALTLTLLTPLAQASRTRCRCSGGEGSPGRSPSPSGAASAS